MSDFDRQLIELIGDLAGGTVWRLRDLVDAYGPGSISRVVADGFGAVFHVPEWRPGFHEVIDEVIGGRRAVPTEDALALIAQQPIPEDYFTHQGASLDLEDEPNLIFSYAADNPAAIAEVRLRNKERRDAWEQKCR